MTAKRVLSVGQCAADHWSLSRTLRSAFGADVTGADTADEALAALRGGGYDLVLVNRVFDYDGSSGVAFVRRVKGDEALRGVPVMLVSNYDGAQEEAVAAGAERGFGKAALGQPPMLARVRPFLGGSEPAS
jgi:DNA-binding response OmpR family regulator